MSLTLPSCSEVSGKQLSESEKRVAPSPKALKSMLLLMRDAGVWTWKRTNGTVPGYWCTVYVQRSFTWGLLAPRCARSAREKSTQPLWRRTSLPERWPFINTLKVWELRLRILKAALCLLSQVTLRCSVPSQFPSQGGLSTG